MKTLKLLKLYAIQVRRDAHTITPVTVPEHEVAILQSVFGEENVQNLRGQPIEGEVELDVVDVVGERGFDDEFDRLASKYGADEKGELLVESVFGKKASKGLDRAMAAAEAKEAKMPKPKADADIAEAKPSEAKPPKAVSKPKADADIAAARDSASTDGK